MVFRLKELRFHEFIKEMVNEASVLTTRNDLQLGRRFVHILSGGIGATAYGLFFSHSQAIAITGAAASITYVLEQVRLRYPELSQKLDWLILRFIRSEERRRESAVIPYVMGALLTIITFPKTIALIAVYTLAFADPLAAIVGITCGKNRMMKGKTIEGSLTFFFVALLCTVSVLWVSTDVSRAEILGVSLVIAFLGTVFEMIPLKLDDNLTIPLVVGGISWMICTWAGIPF